MIKMITDIIDSCQKNIDSMININTATYENTIIPEVNKILAELNKIETTSWLKKINLSKNIDIYVESIAVHMLYSYAKNIKFKYPLHCIINVLIKHPFFINIVQCGKNLNEWKEFVKDIINELQLMYGETDSSREINELKSMLNQVYIDEKKESSIHRFHYLMGFQFESETVGVTGNELLEILKNSSLLDESTIFISINVSFNILNDKSIIIYKNIPKLREKLLNIKTIDLFNPFIEPKQIFKAERDYNILNSKFEKINDLPINYNKAFVILCYNDSEKIKQCHYSLANYTETKYLSKEDTKNFIEYRVLKTIDVKILDFYLKEDFYNKVCSEKKHIEDLKKDYIKLMQLTKETFNRSDQRTFTEKLINSVAGIGLINENELPYFTLYLSKVKTMEPYNLQSVLDYVLSYIYPDLLVNSSTL